MNRATGRPLADEAATLAAGGALARALGLTAVRASGSSVWVVHLNGPLGAGKTTLVRGLLRAAGYHGTVKSPTYTLLEPYALTQVPAGDRLQVFHFDLYRLTHPEELEMLGVRDVLAEVNAVCLIEWPDRGAGYLPAPDIVVDLAFSGEGRILRWQAYSNRAAAALAAPDPGSR